MAHIYDVDSLEFWQIVKEEYVGSINVPNICGTSTTFRKVWDDEDDTSKQKIRNYAFCFKESVFTGFDILIGVEYLFVLNFRLAGVVDKVYIRDEFIEYMINKLSKGK